MKPKSKKLKQQSSQKLVKKVKPKPSFGLAIRNEVNSGNSQMPSNTPTVAPILKQKK
jgi:hypothetical protein